MNDVESWKGPSYRFGLPAELLLKGHQIYTPFVYINQRTSNFFGVLVVDLLFEVFSLCYKSVSSVMNCGRTKTTR